MLGLERTDGMGGLAARLACLEIIASPPVRLSRLSMRLRERWPDLTVFEHGDLWDNGRDLMARWAAFLGS